MKNPPNPPAINLRSLAGFLFSYHPPSKLCLFFGLLVICYCLGLGGCSASSPRFKGSAARTTENRDRGQPRFATKVKEEETREDDRKVDLNEVKERFKNPQPTEDFAVLDRKRMMSEVMNYFGVPYELGGNGPDGIDCSNFTATIYQNTTGTALPRTTSEQFRMGRPVNGGRLKPGDLVFFNTTGERPSHVGIFLGEDLFAHASVSFGVTISSLQSTYYKNRYIGARRVAE